MLRVAVLSLCARSQHAQPAELLGAAPWATADGVTTLVGSAGAEWADLYTPRSAARRHTAGYGGLAAQLARLRRELGAKSTLTLENGQCWSGSGLGHLANGSAGVAASRLLASDARVSSDERVLWPQRAPALYRDYARPVLGNLAAPPAGVSVATRFERDGVQPKAPIWWCYWPTPAAPPHAGWPERCRESTWC